MLLFCMNGQKMSYPLPKGAEEEVVKSLLERPGKSFGKFELHKKPISELMVIFDLPNHSFPL